MSTMRASTTTRTIQARHLAQTMSVLHQGSISLVGANGFASPILARPQRSILTPESLLIDTAHGTFFVNENSPIEIRESRMLSNALTA